MTEQELEDLEELGKTCADCDKYDICSLPKVPICFGFVRVYEEGKEG